MSVLSDTTHLARQTPAARNRAVDFFRAAAIILVMLGHWLVNAPYEADGALHFGRMLLIQPWTQYLTWLFQVMPVFFLVGGYSNAASWSSARREEGKRHLWQAVRMRRLLVPVLPLVIFWAIAAALARPAEIDPELIIRATRGGLVPVWFLAVYILVTGLVPLSYWLWEKMGLLSVALLIAAAALVEIIAFSAEAAWLRWVNYGFIWLALHQLGYWWHRGDFGRRAALALLGFGALSLWLMIGELGYPVSMIGVPGQDISNSYPPTFALLAIGLLQAGIMILLAKPLSHWLLNLRPWTMVILANARIMTLYLWHTTAYVALIGLSLMLDGFGLAWAPGSGEWWLVRLPWIAVLALATGAFMALFGWVEGAAHRKPENAPGPLVAFSGAVIACYGLSSLVLQGISSDRFPGLNIIPLFAALFGIGIAGWTGRRRRK